MFMSGRCKNEFLFYKLALINILFGPPLIEATYWLNYKGGHFFKKTPQPNSLLCMTGTRHTLDEESITHTAGLFKIIRYLNGQSKVTEAARVNHATEEKKWYGNFVFSKIFKIFKFFKNHTHSTFSWKRKKQIFFSSIKRASFSFFSCSISHPVVVVVVIIGYTAESKTVVWIVHGTRGFATRGFATLGYSWHLLFCHSWFCHSRIFATCGTCGFATRDFAIRFPSGNKLFPHCFAIFVTSATVQNIVFWFASCSSIVYK